MTTRLAQSRANVTTPDGDVLAGVSVSSARGRLRISARTGATLVDTTADGVAPVEGGWDVSTPDGVYHVTKAGGCGCR